MRNIINYKAILVMVLGVLCLGSCSLLKPRGKKDAVKTQLPSSKSTDSTKIAAKGPKKFASLITAKAAADSGLFNVYKLEEKYYLEIADSLLGNDVLIVSRITKSAADNRNTQTMLGYGGDQINENVVRFEKGPSNKLFMRVISYIEYPGDSTSTMYRSVLNSNIQPIAAAFEIKGCSKDEKGSIIDLTDYLNGDNDVFFFAPSVKSALKLSGIQADRSYIQKLSAYDSNVEVNTVKTYAKSAAGPGAPGGGFATYELNTSILLLPAKPMRKRYADARVGYFARSTVDFNSNPQGVEKVELATRWRLEPKPADVQRYLSGELVEPSKQIVFYIDPATPKQWVPYLIQGVNDWNVAFEKAGFKNAIVAREAPLADSTWSLEDARYSAIVYKSSAIPNASGPHVHDPRTGEILETHVNWYHNIMQLLRNWYFVQSSAIDPRARKPELDEKLMGQLIRFVSSHEVGHTLGLRHNFGSSSTVPVEKLRDKEWLRVHGHTPSIMDYARFNYVAQPEDGVDESGIFPRIGDYDKWAIEWAYRWYPEDRFASAAEEKAYLNKWVIERTSGDKRLWFGHEKDADDPRSQNEDLGDNAMKAGAYGIKNLKRIVPQLVKWTKEPGKDYSMVTERYRELLGQYGRYMGHVLKNIGGVMTTPKTSEQSGAVVAFVPKAKQQEAMRFLQEQLFATPLWLLDKDIFAKTGGGSIITIIRQQDAVLNKLLSSATMYKLLQFEGNSGPAAYSLAEMLGDLQSGIFSELRGTAPVSIYRRNLQKSYVEKMIGLVKPVAAPAGPPGMPQGMAMTGGPDMKATDMYSVVKMKLRELLAQIGSAGAKDKMTKAHLMDLKERIEGVFEK